MAPVIVVAPSTRPAYVASALRSRRAEIRRRVRRQVMLRRLRRELAGSANFDAVLRRPPLRTR